MFPSRSSRKLISHSQTRKEDQANGGHFQATSRSQYFVCGEVFLIIRAVVFTHYFGIRTLFHYHGTPNMKQIEEMLLRKD